MIKWAGVMGAVHLSCTCKDKQENGKPAWGGGGEGMSGPGMQPMVETGRKLHG